MLFNKIQNLNKFNQILKPNSGIQPATKFTIWKTSLLGVQQLLVSGLDPNQRRSRLMSWEGQALKRCQWAHIASSIWFNTNRCFETWSNFEEIKPLDYTGSAWISKKSSFTTNLPKQTRKDMHASHYIPRESTSKKSSGQIATPRRGSTEWRTNKFQRRWQSR